MIAYSKKDLQNLRIQDAVKADHGQGIINGTELKAIVEKYPVSFYTPALAARVGLFILTCVIIAFSDGLLSLFILDGVSSPGGWALFLAVLTYAGLELIIYLKNHFRSGVDDALLFMAACQFVTAFAFILFSEKEDFLVLSLVIFVVTLFFTVRFIDRFMSVMCCIGFFAVIFFTVKEMGAVGEPVIPFVMIIVAGGLYRLVARLETNKLLVNYSGCLIVAEIVALLTFYAAGNYYVVQSLSNLLHGTTKPIAFGPFFWAWTILIPLVYLLRGVRKKDVILLRTGLILIAAAVVTVRNYYHLLQIDLMLTFSGIFVLGLVYALMKYLTMPKHGFTLEVATDAHMLDHLKVESLIIGETFSPAQVDPQGVKFGGGDFGGGGSSGGF